MPGTFLAIYGLAMLIWLLGRSHDHDLATWAAAPDTSAEVSPAIIITHRARPFRPVGQSDWSVRGYTPAAGAR